MKKITKFSKRIKITYFVGACLSCLVMLIVNPVISNRGDRDGTFYRIVINGQEEGTVLEENVANDLVMQARKQIASESQDIVYMDYSYEIVPDKKIVGSVDNLDVVKDNVYQELKSCIVATKQKAYTIKIDDFSITLPSKDAVISLLSEAKNKYDQENQFSIDLIQEEKQELIALQPNIYKMSKSPNQTDKVTEGTQQTDANGQQPEATTGDLSGEAVTEDGILDISFEQKIEVVETYVQSEEITDLETAINLVTKDQEKNKIYEVISGDCLSVVAQKNNVSVSKIVEMNENLDENTVLQIGDEIVVTVPEPELSVIVTEQTTYEEEYTLPVEYIENDNWFTTKQEVMQEGSSGFREVTAKLTQRNGKETNREIIEENIITEAIPKIIQIGTQEPPTFIKPITGGRFTSGFGKRWGRMHKGVDWACPVGTAVKASCNGTVVSAGWSNGYGYCITIKHSNGMQTRYGHLSKILVSSGDKVSQGDKIALSGNTGRSTGPHVHFEIIVNGDQSNPLNYLN
ncbi:M23 family metallopeptidase [Candidatus Galacturonibacter soehngenii]|uniref:Peptidoglycan DD-metalloendopeptidase family protein n=1 Tax=Candidatus Galacturonatibacter soehngenii TaxID=2307010 RepID=A0A7V7QL06_9FIRM|nr:M23 family metallopeptidase [Candidatus Galacturonibacter soehngenii]KAB1438597.1 peptidoglycan DD-metalloendopeptidase family protein [Candidatus Galacturonibacter soehngenii]